MSKSLLMTLVADDKIIEFQNMDKFLEIVNQDPPASWLEDHPLAKGVKYLPIERVEWMLDKMFQEWYPEVISYGSLFNSITCHVRLHYKHPLSDWTYKDGVAAVPAKTSKGAAASDMTQILSEAVMTGLPAAKSFAIKDAADHIGKIFGRDINRKTQLEFIGSYTEQSDTVEDILAKIKAATTAEQLRQIRKDLDPALKLAILPAIENRLKEMQDGGE